MSSRSTSRTPWRALMGFACLCGTFAVVSAASPPVVGPPPPSGSSGAASISRSADAPASASASTVAFRGDDERATNQASWGTMSERLIMVFAGLALVVTAYQAVMFRRQLGEMRAQLELAKRSADIAEKTFLGSERPWLFPSVSGPKIDGEVLRRFVAGERPRLVMLMPQIALLNYGKSPAALDRVQVKYGDSDNTYRDAELSDIVLPGQHYLIEARDTGGHLSLTPDNLDHWKMNLPSFIATVRYRTQYGERKEVSFAFQMTSYPAGAWKRIGGPDANYDRTVVEDD